MNRITRTLLFALLLFCPSLDAFEPNTIQASLHGLEFTFDARTGGMLSMVYPGPGKMLDAQVTDASLIDLAYPIEKFGAFANAPFPELALNEDRLSIQFCQDIAYGAANYTSGGMFSGRWLRWFDFGRKSWNHANG